MPHPLDRPLVFHCARLYPRPFHYRGFPVRVCPVNQFGLIVGERKAPRWTCTEIQPMLLLCLDLPCGAPLCCTMRTTCLGLTLQSNRCGGSQEFKLFCISLSLSHPLTKPSMATPDCCSSNGSMHRVLSSLIHASSTSSLIPLQLQRQPRL
jgi:hypothetical protein